MTKEGVCTPKAWTGTAGAPAGPEPQASQPHKEAPPRTSKRLFSAQTPHCLMCACGSARDRCRAARFPVQLPGLGGEGDGSSPGSDRGGPGARGPKPGRGGLCSLRPIRTQACPDGRLGALPGPGGGGGFGALIVKKPVDPAGGVENPVAPARDATSLREGFPHLLGRAHPAHSLHRPDRGLSEYTIDGPPLHVPGRREDCANQTGRVVSNRGLRFHHVIEKEGGAVRRKVYI